MGFSHKMLLSDEKVGFGSMVESRGQKNKIAPCLNHTELNTHLQSFIATRMANMKKMENVKCWQGCVCPSESSYTSEDGKLLQPLWKYIWQHRLKLNISIPYDPTILPKKFIQMLIGRHVLQRSRQHYL